MRWGGSVVLVKLVVLVELIQKKKYTSKTRKQGDVLSNFSLHCTVESVVIKLKEI